MYLADVGITLTGRLDGFSCRVGSSPLKRFLQRYAAVALSPPAMRRDDILRMSYSEPVLSLLAVADKAKLWVKPGIRRIFNGTPIHTNGLKVAVAGWSRSLRPSLQPHHRIR